MAHSDCARKRLSRAPLRNFYPITRNRVTTTPVHALQRMDGVGARPPRSVKGALDRPEAVGEGGLTNRTRERRARKLAHRPRSTTEYSRRGTTVRQRCPGQRSTRETRSRWTSRYSPSSPSFSPLWSSRQRRSTTSCAFRSGDPGCSSSPHRRRRGHCPGRPVRARVRRDRPSWRIAPGCRRPPAAAERCRRLRSRLAARRPAGTE